MDRKSHDPDDLWAKFDDEDQPVASPGLEPLPINWVQKISSDPLTARLRILIDLVEQGLTTTAVDVWALLDLIVDALLLAEHLARSQSEDGLQRTDVGFPTFSPYYQDCLGNPEQTTIKTVIRRFPEDRVAFLEEMRESLTLLLLDAPQKHSLQVSDARSEMSPVEASTMKRILHVPEQVRLINRTSQAAREIRQLSRTEGRRPAPKELLKAILQRGMHPRK